MDDALFKKWIGSYPDDMRGKFHRDGIIDKHAFDNEKMKILFVVKEPNGENQYSNKSQPVDLRKKWRERVPRKPFDYSIARWTGIICDGNGVDYRPRPKEISQNMRRVAIINLKKMSGKGRENREEISLYSYGDRGFLRSQILQIKPKLILCCSKDGFVSRMLWRIANDSLFVSPRLGSRFSISLGHGSQMDAFNVYHPSVRLARDQKRAAEAVHCISEVLKREKSISS